MSVRETDKIDAFSVDKEAQRVFLSIIDPLAWDAKDVHLFTLQEKINTYLYFIESGKLAECLPESKGCDIAIELILRYYPSENAIAFLDKTMQILFSKNIVFIFGPDKKMGYEN